MDTPSERAQPTPDAAALQGRHCFVTVGATVSFRPLLEEVLSPAFLNRLAAHGFASLVVQTGPAQAWAESVVQRLPATRPNSSTEAAARSTARPWPSIQVIRYTTDMLSHMLPCRGEPGRRRPGAVIAHAGAGSILDAARIDAPLLVVANPALLDNHQAELASAVDAAGWAVEGTLGSLDAALDRLIVGADKAVADIAAYREPVFPTPEADRSGLFDWAALSTYGLSLGPESNLLRLD